MILRNSCHRDPDHLLSDAAKAAAPPRRNKLNGNQQPKQTNHHPDATHNCQYLP